MRKFGEYRNFNGERPAALRDHHLDFLDELYRKGEIAKSPYGIRHQLRAEYKMLSERNAAQIAWFWVLVTSPNGTTATLGCMDIWDLAFLEWMYTRTNMQNYDNLRWSLFYNTDLTINESKDITDFYFALMSELASGQERILGTNREILETEEEEA